MSFPSEKIIWFSNPREYFSITESTTTCPLFSILYSLAITFFKEVYFHSSSLVVGNPFDRKESRRSFLSSDI
ncbi:MAG: hypothetical protein HOA49_03435 [Flavobacteriales bacterium]|nr:hypothetical protein [Flavobacteriales bacterium]